jgi:hypothetical protein
MNATRRAIGGLGELVMDCCTKQLFQQFPWEELLIRDAELDLNSVVAMMR